jgi:hypothetical protein
MKKREKDLNLMELVKLRYVDYEDTPSKKQIKERAKIDAFVGSWWCCFNGETKTNDTVQV